MSRREYRESNSAINYGTHMGSDTRLAYYPDRALRKYAQGEWQYGTPDPLACRPFFARGEAAERGWALMAWRNEYMRAIAMQRATSALAARVVLPLP